MAAHERVLGLADILQELVKNKRKDQATADQC